MILLIDNYDSFTFNLVQYLGELKAEVLVKRNDEITISEIKDLNPSHIVISPGPCTPNEAGISVDVVKELGSQYPILGVCLGHQSIGVAFGGRVIRADQIMHGKTSLIHHKEEGLFKGIKNPFVATRYHSLIIEKNTMPKDLKITAQTEDGVVMAVQHESLPIFGLQFHPESILTAVGHDLLRNFIS